MKNGSPSLTEGLPLLVMQYLLLFQLKTVFECFTNVLGDLVIAVSKRVKI